MARLNARWSRFWADTKYYKRFWQAYPVDGSGAGTTLTVTASLTAGHATGTAVASGAALSVNNTALIAGHANVTQPGATLSETLSVIAGNANVTQPGVTFTDTVSVIAGHADVAHPGVTLTETISLIAGVANVTANGATFKLDLGVIPGVASGITAGDAVALGATITATISVIGGTATGNFIRIEGGAPFGPAWPRREVVNAVAFGKVLTVRAEIHPGKANGTVVARAREYVRQDPILSQIVPSAAYVTPPVASVRVVRELLIEAGKASGDAIAYGQLIEGTRDWGPYDDDVLVLVLA